MFSTVPCLLDFARMGSDAIGYLTVAQRSGLPFAIQRVYWTYQVPPDTIRGGHAHHDLEQLIFAVNGQIGLSLEGVKGDKHEFMLSQPDQGLYVPRLYWRDITFSDQAVLMCLASEEYTEDDYIREYSEFKKLQHAYS
ncbi:sugar 3,4-ketoisomerase [Hymenobacter metallilatus]|uniref:WxcM-like domain-containing protein n=1 Tax=Hymenobacter metallilatus TaxID=2493666 RepID=A0A428JR43_9BACT|nr:FdtA/QdtA family cupin domain-containing protein [Hymenobacter metallilatus]RSK36049.1 WxcM-like domain-containing protein [Hymenobacter metallilatus]